MRRAIGNDNQVDRSGALPIGGGVKLSMERSRIITKKTKKQENTLVKSHYLILYT